MSLAGEGAVAIWHDIAPEGREVFYAWHGEEHMPERVGIPGFLRGRRYVARQAELEFFNLYEALSPQVLTGVDYRSRLDAPTPWTLQAVKHFRGVARSICRVLASYGRGHGGLMTTWRYDVPDDHADAHRRAVALDLLPKLAAAPGIAGAHLLLADVEASAVENAERKARAEANRIPRWILLVEGWGDEAPFDATCEAMAGEAVLRSHGAQGPIAIDRYRLQMTRGKTDGGLG